MQIDPAWKEISSAPQDGTRCRVGHMLDPSSLKIETICPTSGVFEAGEWACNNAFICVDGFLRWQPTHWFPDEGATQ